MTEALISAGGGGDCGGSFACRGNDNQQPLKQQNAKRYKNRSGGDR